MAKIILSDLGSTTSTSTLNENFRKIQDALNNKVLYRVNPSGEPNQMENLLDMNSNDIINAGVITAKRVIASSIEGGGESIIEGGLDDNEIVKWDAGLSKFVGTGVYSNGDGEITTASNSVNVGIHDIGSAGRNVIMTNRVDNRHFASVDQELSLDDAQNTNAMQRERGAVEEYAFGEESTDIIDTPAWTFSSIADQTVFSITLWPAADMDTVIYEVLEQGQVIYRDYLTGFTLDDNAKEFILSTPYDLYSGVTYTARLTGAGGVPISKFRGGSDGKPWYKVKLRTFTSKELATKEYVDSIPIGGAEEFTQLTDTPSSYDTPKHLVRINEFNTGLEFTPNTLANNFTDVNITSPEEGDILLWTGAEWQNELPIPDMAVTGVLSGRVIGALEDRVSNYLYVANDAEYTNSMPNATDKHWLYVVNKNTAIDDIVQLTLRSGTTLDGSTDPLVVQQQYQRLVSYNEGTSEWETIFNKPLVETTVKENLEDLLDVAITNPNNGQVLEYEAGIWKNADKPVLKETLESLTDTDIISPQNGQALLYNNGQWENSNVVEELSHLTDVQVTSPTNGQILEFKDGNWENVDKPDSAIVEISNDGVNYGPLDKLYVKENPLILEVAGVGTPNDYTLDINTQGLYEKPVNAMYLPQGPITIQQQGDQTAQLLFFNEPALSDSRIKVNEPLNGYTLEAYKAIPTLYFVRVEIFSDSLVVAPPTGGDYVPVSFSLVDMTTFLPVVGGTSLLDVTGKPLDTVFRAHVDQPFGRHVLEGIIAVTGTPTQLGIQIKCNLGDSVTFNPTTDCRISFSQLSDPDNKATLTSLLEGQLSGGVSTQRSFVLGGDFLSQPFDLGATSDVQTLNQGSQVRVANGWWLDAVVDDCNYQRTSEGLKLSGANTGGAFLPELHHVINSDVTKAFGQRSERVTFTVKAKYDEPVYVYVLGWNGVPDGVPSSILTGYSDENHTYLPSIQKLGSQELLKEGVGLTEKTATVTVTVPTGISNLIISVTAKQVYPNDITIEAVKGESGEEFTGWQVSDIQDNQPFAFGAAQVDTTDTSYPLETTTPVNLPLNTLVTDRPNEPYVILDDANDYLIFAQKGRYLFSYQLEYYRVNNTGGTIQYGVWLEESTDGGLNWTPIQGSGSRVSVPSQDAGGVRTICCAFPYVTDNTNNTLIRGRHAVTNAGAGIEIRSFAADSVFPVAPAWRLSGTKL